MPELSYEELQELLYKERRRKEELQEQLDKIQHANWLREQEEKRLKWEALPMNAKRLVWAKKALAAHDKATGEENEPLDQRVKDTISDLCHLLFRQTEMTVGEIRDFIDNAGLQFVDESDEPYK